MDSTAPQDSLTKAQIIAAFENWEKDFRENTSKFFTADEMVELEVASLSESRTLWLFAYARQTTLNKET